MSRSTNISTPPWSIDQVESLIIRQNVKHLHPYTCEHCGEKLIPTKDGWMCGNNIVQDWCWSSDLFFKEIALSSNGLGL